jgi:hypothetical protein
MHHYARRTTTLLTSLAALAACGGPPPDAGEPTGSSEAPIVAGDPYTQDWHAVDFPKYAEGTGCSGVALDEQWVLTAKHCTVVDPDNNCNWGTHSQGPTVCTGSTSLVINVDTVRHVRPGNVPETRVIREIYRHPSDGACPGALHLVCPAWA